MALTPGTRLGPYEVVTAIGAGGMGEVYRARDTRLNRDVAIKVLPEAFAADEDRLARFTREAQALAALNHPNIAAIYGLEELPAGMAHAGGRALVMELVEGDDLSVVIAHGRSSAGAEAPALHQHKAPALHQSKWSPGASAPGIPQSKWSPGASAPGIPQSKWSPGASAPGIPQSKWSPGASAPGIPLADVLPLARQIADALEAAHEQGIIHRDLKPANVKVRPDGTVKVLDFGLAKALGPPGAEAPGLHRDNAGLHRESPGLYGAGDAMNSPTLTAQATQAGIILGTAAYMAPEQAKGRPVDKRADIWAFGVVLYEMLTGRRAFQGEDVSTTLAAVLMRDPEWTSLPADTPAALGTLIRRCLDRDPKTRLRDIGEARVLLADPEAVRARAASADAASSVPPSRMPWLVAALALAAAATLGALWVSGPAATSPPDRLELAILPPQGHRLGTSVVLAPDGRRLVMEVEDEATGGFSLWLRDLSSGVPTKLAGSDGGIQPFWSPDGLQIAFFADGKLKKTDLQGSPPQVIGDAPFPRGGAWGPDDTIVFAGSFRAGLETVAAAGGTRRPLTALDEARGEKSHRWPVFLPGGTHILFLAQTGEATARDDNSTIEALELATGTRTVLVRANSSPLYTPDGFLLFWREGALRAQAFDARRLTVSGQVLAVAPGVAFDANEYAFASVSTTGLLAYSTAAAASRSNLMLVDRSGRPLRTVAESVLAEGGLALSHDGTRLAASITADGARDSDIWLFDLERGTSGPLTFDQGVDANPLWSVDDTRVVYTNRARNDGVVFQRFADGRGQPEQLAADAVGMFSRGWSRDRTWLLVEAGAAATAFDLFRYDLASRTATPLVQTPFNDSAGALSPDDRWVAYQGDETGRYEVYVQSLGDEAGRWRISTAGGWAPAWRQDGRELYYVTPLGQLMAVAIQPGPSFRPSAPVELFRTEFPRLDASRGLAYGPAPDGQRFAILVLRERRQEFVTLVTRWAPAGASR